MVYAAQASMHVAKLLVKSEYITSPSTSNLQYRVNLSDPRTTASQISSVHRQKRKVTGGKDDEQEYDKYVVPLVLSGVSAHPSSIRASDVAVAAKPDVVTETVLVGTELSTLASLLAFSLARRDSTPVAADRPMTAAERRAMIHDKTTTRRLQPHIFMARNDACPFLCFGVVVVVVACAPAHAPDTAGRLREPCGEAV